MLEPNYTGLQKKFPRVIFIIQLAFLLLNTDIKDFFLHHVQIFRTFVTKV